MPDENDENDEIAVEPKPDDAFTQMRIEIEIQKKDALGRPNLDLALFKREPGKGAEAEELVGLVHVTHEPDPDYPRRGDAPWHTWIETPVNERTYLPRVRSDVFSEAMMSALEYLADGIEDEWHEMFRAEINEVRRMPSGPHTYNLSLE